MLGNFEATQYNDHFCVPLAEKKVIYVNPRRTERKVKS